MIDPGTEQVWEALRALYLMGQIDDLPRFVPTNRICPTSPTMYASRLSKQRRPSAIEALRGSAGILPLL